MMSWSTQTATILIIQIVLWLTLVHGLAHQQAVETGDGTRNEHGYMYDGTVAAAIPDTLTSFVLNFDEHPSTRYNKVFHYYKKTLIVMENDMMHSIAPAYRDLVQNNTEKYLENNPEAYYAMNSLANITGLPLWQTLLVNSVVDITSFCTSVVARMSNGTIIHGRNLDFDYPAVLQTLVYRAYVEKNGVIIAEAACLAGYVGFYTAVRYSTFTVTFNVRMLAHLNTSDITANIEREWESGVIPAAQAIQEAVLWNSSFVTAVDFLSQRKLNIPCYIILAGTNEASQNGDYPGGVILARDPYGLNHTQELDVDDNWYIVQTNADWWAVSDTRYNTTVSNLEILGQASVNMSSLVTDVLNKTGVVQLITIFSSSLSAQLNSLDVYFTPLEV
jgi:hypothetical protein